MKSLQEIDAKYRNKIEKGNKTIRIDTDDYIELYNMAEYSEILQNTWSQVYDALSSLIKNGEYFEEEE